MKEDHTALAIVLVGMTLFLAYRFGEIKGYRDGTNLHYIGPGTQLMWESQLDGYHACLMWKEKAKRIPDLKHGLPEDCRTVHPSCDLFQTDCPASSIQ